MMDYKLTGEIRENVFVYVTWRVAFGTSVRVLESCLYAVLAKAVTAFSHVSNIDEVKTDRTCFFKVKVRKVKQKEKKNNNYKIYSIESLI